VGNKGSGEDLGWLWVNIIQYVCDGEEEGTVGR